MGKITDSLLVFQLLTIVEHFLCGNFTFMHQTLQHKIQSWCIQLQICAGRDYLRMQVVAGHEAKDLPVYSIKEN